MGSILNNDEKLTPGTNTWPEFDWGEKGKPLLKEVICMQSGSKYYFGEYEDYTKICLYEDPQGGVSLFNHSDSPLFKSEKYDGKGIAVSVPSIEDEKGIIKTPFIPTKNSDYRGVDSPKAWLSDEVGQFRRPAHIYPIHLDLSTDKRMHPIVPNEAFALPPELHGATTPDDKTFYEMAKLADDNWKPFWHENDALLNNIPKGTMVSIRSSLYKLQHLIIKLATNSIVQWSYNDKDEVQDYLKGNTYQGKVLSVNFKDNTFEVAAEYGVDHIPFDKISLKS